MSNTGNIPLDTVAIRLVRDRLHEIGVECQDLGFDFRSIDIKEGPDREPGRRRYTIELVFKR